MCYRRKDVYLSPNKVMIPDFVVPLIVGACIQIIKLIIDLFLGGKLGRNALRSAGGFPSVHSGIAASITTLMYLQYGHDSAAFMIAFGFSFLFWYDAANVRYEAGQHASYLNQLNEELGDILMIEKYPEILKERLGHTFVEVLGGITIGVAITFVYYLLYLN